jgi:hypothetical protein
LRPKSREETPKEGLRCKSAAFEVCAALHKQSSGRPAQILDNPKHQADIINEPCSGEPPQFPGPDDFVESPPTGPVNAPFPPPAPANVPPTISTNALTLVIWSGWPRGTNPPPWPAAVVPVRREPASARVARRMLTLATRICLHCANKSLVAIPCISFQLGRRVYVAGSRHHADDRPEDSGRARSPVPTVAGRDSLRARIPRALRSALSANVGYLVVYVYGERKSARLRCSEASRKIQQSIPRN